MTEFMYAAYPETDVSSDMHYACLAVKDSSRIAGSCFYQERGELVTVVSKLGVILNHISSL